MPGSERIQNIAVILTPLIRIANHQGNRGTGGLALVDTTEDLDGIGLTALRDMTRGTWAATVEIGLNVGLGQRHARRATVNDAANGRTMRLAEIRDREQMTKGAARHSAYREE